MSLPNAATAAKNPPALAHYGQIIEYIQNRIYLAAYTHPPDENTPFPYPSRPSHSPTKRPSKSPHRTSRGTPGPNVHPPFYFTVDEALPYNRFHLDFGPLHMGHVYRFAYMLNFLLADPTNQHRAVVLWSKPDSRSRANAACLVACYMVLVQEWPPHLALAPIAQAEPPMMPFRDAGYSQADFSISIQDVLYGVWRAKQESLCTFDGFKIDEYERYERVDQGDFNWITPSFVALASPQHELIQTIPTNTELYASLPSNTSAIKQNRNLSSPFRNVLSHFRKRNVGLVIRLNSQLYSPSYFNALGINHLDMIFDDGTCPPLHMVKRFIRLAHEMITVRNKSIAVHCKAGLGRTGCLIGAYLIYRHGFTANEIIAYMRFMRPGMVVGPQQHWLHLNQGQFREWWFEDKMKAKLAAYLPSTPTKSARQRHVSNGQTATPPNQSSQSGKRSALGEITHNGTAINATVVDENLPAPTPGQPRKGGKTEARHHPYSRVASASLTSQPVPDSACDRVVETGSHRQHAGLDPGEDEEEWELRVQGRMNNADSPMASEKRRAVSYTTTTTSSTRYSYAGQDELLEDIVSDVDVENWKIHDDNPSDKPLRPKAPAPVKSGSGSGTLGVAKMRVTPGQRSGDSREIKQGGVRKTSTRVVSVGGASRSRS